MEHLSDKELLRQGRYYEALGPNYVAKSWCVFLMRDGVCYAHLKNKKGEDKRFYSFEQAKDYMENKCKIEFAENEHWMAWDMNSDWL